MEKRIIKVGDFVLITKSDINFTASMCQYVGKVAKVTKVTSLGFDGGEQACRIDLDRGLYEWRESQGHFVLLPDAEEKPSSVYRIPKDKWVKYSDKISFYLKDEGTFKYRVMSTHIDCEEYNNAVIFTKLGMSADERIKFCEEVYGYEPDFGMCPECKSKDYEALTRLIIKLHEACNVYNSQRA